MRMHPLERSSAFIEPIRAKLLTMPDDTVVYPGHGRPTTIGAERRDNPYVGGE